MPLAIANKSTTSSAISRHKCHNCPPDAIITYKPRTITTDWSDLDIATISFYFINLNKNRLVSYPYFSGTVSLVSLCYSGKPITAIVLSFDLFTAVFYVQMKHKIYKNMNCVQQEREHHH